MSAARGARLPRLAVTLPQFTERPGPALAAAADARRLGFAGAFVFDHLWPLGGDRARPALECWTLLAGVAAATREQPEGFGEPQGGAPISREGFGEPQGGAPISREGFEEPQGGAPVNREGFGEPQGGAPVHRGFRVGTLVTRAGLRSPAVVARMAATVGAVGGAPAVIGVGRGDLANRDENEAYGLPFGDPRERAAALEATVAALRGPLAGSPAPEVWVGGVGRGAQELAGRLADTWNGWARTPAEVAAGLAAAREAAERAGRDPAAVAATWGGQVLVAPSRREVEARLARWAPGRAPDELARVVAGDPETVLERLGELGDAGASWCVLAMVAGPGDEMRAQLAEAAGLGVREQIS